MGHPLSAISYFIICGEKFREFSALSNFPTQNTFFLITAVMSAFRSSKYQCHREFLFIWNHFKMAAQSKHPELSPNSEKTGSTRACVPPSDLELLRPWASGLLSQQDGRTYSTHLKQREPNPTDTPLRASQQGDTHIATTDLLLWRCLSHLNFPIALSGFTAR